MISRALAAIATSAVAASLVALVPGAAHAGVADAPTAPVRYLSTPAQTPLQGNFCLGATDPQGDAAKVVAVDAAPHSATYDQQTCAFTFTPAANSWGQYDLTFKLSDGTNTSDWQKLVVSVGRPGNAPVVAQPDAFTAGKNLRTLIPDLDGTLRANDVDPEGGPVLTANNTSSESGLLPGEDLVSAPFLSPTAYVYTPPTNFVGVRRFTYLARDEAANTTEQVYTITITDKGAQKAPVAVGDSYPVPKNGSLVMTKATGVLANDSDADSAYVRVVFPTQPAHGTLTGFKTYDGTWTYTPDVGFTGVDTFTYVLEDSEGNKSGTATVTLTVTAPPPVAVADSYKTAQSTTKVVDAAHGLLANDSDPDSGFIVANLLTAGLHGTIVLNYQSGAFTWTPTPGWSGTDTIAYRLGDPDGGYSAWTSIVLKAVAPGANEAPEAAADVHEVRQGTSLVLGAGQGLLANDSDFEGADLDVASHTEPAHGTLSAVDLETGAFTYTGDAGWHGTDTFTYRAVDAQGVQSAPATVTVEVFNDKPVAQDDAYATVPGVPFVVPAADGLHLNDSDPEGEAIETRTTWEPLHGTVSTAADGSFTYTPDAGFEGVDTFAYTVRDASQYESDPATVTITVQPGVLSAPTPTVLGTARVGRIVSAGTPTWGPGVVTKTYQWFRSSTPIPGATTATYRLTAADLGRSVRVRVSGAKAGYPSVVLMSAAKKVGLGTLTSTTPRISGTPRVGSTLKVLIGTWGPGTVTRTVRWYRNGVAISGATSSSYRLTRADRGRRITVRVSGRKSGYSTLVRPSAAVMVR